MTPRRLTFTYSEILPAEDLLSEWLVTISAAANDLITVHDLMEQQQNDPERFFYWFRLAVAHFYEVGSHLHETRNVAEIRMLVASLPQPTRDRLRTVLDLYTRRKRALSNIRNGTFHYPSLMDWRNHQTVRQRRDVTAVLRTLARETGEARLGVLRESRLGYADEVLARLAVRKSGGIRNYASLIEELRRGVMEFMRFMNEAIEEHLIRARNAGAMVTVTP